jgi:hypothetical protein
VSLGAELDIALKPGTIRAEKDGAVAEVEVDDVDRLGARVRAVRVTGATRIGVTEHVERLAHAGDALGETLRPVEVAPTLGGAVLRGPARGRGEREFFEVRTDGRTVGVERWRVGPDGRAPTGFTVTREQLRRLVDDLDESLGGEGPG